MQQICHHTIVENKLNDNFSLCDHRIYLPCDAGLIVITSVLIYVIIVFIVNYKVLHFSECIFYIIYLS